MQSTKSIGILGLAAGALLLAACTVEKTNVAPGSTTPTEPSPSGSGCQVVTEPAAESCSGPDECTPLACECEDGSKTSVQSCVNGSCAAFKSCYGFCKSAGSSMCGYEPALADGPRGNRPPHTNDGPATGGPPTTVTLVGKIVFGKPSTTLSSDKKTLITLVSGGADTLTPTPAVDVSYYTPRVDEAESMQVVSPPLGSCTAKPQFGIGSGRNATMQFFGVDVLPAGACTNWAKAAVASGVEVKFSNVPYGNSKTVATTLTLKLNP